MKTVKTLTRVKINKKSVTPIKSQLYDQLRQWIETADAGARLPAERRLAEMAGVARGTVREAVKTFAKEGLLERNVKGTFVSKPARYKKGQEHPFALHTRMVIPKIHSISFMLFEKTPQQHAVWERIVDMFNHAHAACRLAINWVPMDVNTLDLYRRFIEEQKPDVVQILSQFAVDLEREKFWLSLPGDLSETLRSGKYLSEAFGIREEGMLSYVLPMHFSPWGVFWNVNLAGEKDDSGGELFKEKHLVAWMQRIGGRLPEHCLLLPNIWHLPTGIGIPVKTPTEKAFVSFFNQSFGMMEDLRELR